MGKEGFLRLGSLAASLILGNTAVTRLVPTPSSLAPLLSGEWLLHITPAGMQPTGQNARLLTVTRLSGNNQIIIHSFFVSLIHSFIHQMLVIHFEPGIVHPTENTTFQRQTDPSLTSRGLFPAGGTDEITE